MKKAIIKIRVVGVAILISNSISLSQTASPKTLDSQSLQDFTRVTSGAIVNDGGFSASANWADYDNDGDLDLFVANRGNQNNFLYRNNGSGSFTAITSGDIVNDGGDSYGAAWGDYDNDGFPDLFVANDDQDNSLYRNNRNGSFSKITSGPVVNDGGKSRSGSWADYDNDGDLDLYVANTGDENNFLYRNNGNGSFTKITSGVVVTDGSASTGATWADIDNDGDLDLFVTTFGQDNRLYRNNGAGSFTRITTGAIVNDNGHSFSSSWGDFNNDGYLDLFVSNDGGEFVPGGEDNFLYVNNGNGTFSKVTSSSIVSDEGRSFGSAWGDYDNDGDLDLFVANKADTDFNRQQFNFLYRNSGPPNYSFTKITTGNIVTDQRSSFGSGWGDFNNDGYLDIFIAAFDQNNLLYRNNESGKNWINVSLVGTTSNRLAVGARVSVKAILNGTSIWQFREVSTQTGGGYASQNSLNVEFGLADAARIDSLIINWPSQIKQTLTNVAVNQFLTIEEQETSTVGTLHVATTGNDANAGTAAAPLRNIQTALNRAEDGDTVKVAVGIYTEGLLPQSRVVLLGGYSNSFKDSEHDRFANQTIIEGVSTNMLTDTHGITLDGFIFDGVDVAEVGLDIRADATIRHNIIKNVTQSVGFGAKIADDAIFANNTLDGNIRAVDIFGGQSALAKVKNNIIVNNSFGIINSADPSVHSYNDVFNNSINYAGSNNFAGIGDINLDPLFFDPENNDYRVPSTSPTVDRGDPADPVGEEPEPNGGRIDMGAYGGTRNAATANQPPNGTIDQPTQNVTITQGSSVSFAGTGSDPDNHLPLSFLWDFDGGAANSNVEDPGNVVFNTAGVYNVRFVVTDALGLSDPTPPTRQVNVNAPDLPQIQLSRSSINFGDVTVNFSAEATLTVTNTGSADLIVDNVSLTGANAADFVYDGVTNFTLASQNDRILTVKFSPQSTGVKTATLRIEHNASGSPTNVTLTGNGVAQDVPVFEANKSAVDFGSLRIGSSREDSVRISNPGSAELEVDVEITGANASEFSLQSPSSLTVDSSEATQVLLRFSPTTVGSKEALLIITHNASGSPDTTSLSGFAEDLDRQPPVITNVQAPAVVAKNTAFEVSAEITDESGIDEVRLLYREGGQNSFVTGTMTAESDVYTGTIPGNSVGNRGVEFTIMAIDPDGNTRTEDLHTVQVQLAENEFTKSHAGGSLQSAYRLRSFPLDMDNASVNSALLDDLGQPDTTRWRLWDIERARATTQFPFREVTSIGDLGRGKSMFLITKETTTLTSEAGVTVSTQQPFTINLLPGWNMIANPFNFTIPIENVEPESLRANIFTYTGNWLTPSSLQPFEGYLIKVSQAQTLSMLPSESSANPQSALTKTSNQMEADSDWHIRIEGRCQEASDGANFVGVSKLADTEWDRLERYEPPPIGEYVMVAFPHRDWRVNPDVYSTDFRPPSDEGYVWEFTVDSNIGRSPLTLDFGNLESLPPNFEARLIDLELQVTQDLRLQNSYVFSTGARGIKKRFQLMVGESEYVREAVVETAGLPAAFELAQNFPNPFNPTTSIRFGLPEAAPVTLRVYNLLGEEVVTLLKEANRETGYNVVVWDGKDGLGRPMPSGIYIYRLQVGQRAVLTKKMTLLK